VYLKNKSKILLVAGTRPEVIKLSSTYSRLQESNYIDPIFCSTGQQTDLLQDTLASFQIVPDVVLSSNEGKSSLNETMSRIINEIDLTLNQNQYEGVIVQGDTTTSAAAALASFNKSVPVFHIEAGLRSNSLSSPYPEEGNRRLISSIAALHFAPTLQASANLLREGIKQETIFVTGNTGIDAFKFVRDSIASDQTSLDKYKNELLVDKNRILLLTCHRRESFGNPIREIFKGILKAIKSNSDLRIIYPLHPNPNVNAVAHEYFDNVPAVYLVPPQRYSDFIKLMMVSDLIVTDSGGIQEEACQLDVPVLILREVTERSEALALDGIELVKLDSDSIELRVSDLLGSRFRMRDTNAFGSGAAGLEISKEIENFVKLRLVKDIDSSA
jgi:UDP-N-acetylglucosamine 2-epimerase (non-hydrolysing)